MSAAIAINSSGTASHVLGSGSVAVGSPRGEASVYKASFRSLGTIGVAHASSEVKQLRQFTVKRRLKGFLSEVHGTTCRAIFVVNGKEVPYDLPAKQLKQAGVEVRYQPFEMDELEPNISGVAGKVYRFRASAKSNDVTMEMIPLDPERIRKRDLIFAKLKKA